MPSQTLPAPPIEPIARAEPAAAGAPLAEGERQLGRLDALLADPDRRRRYLADAARREILATIVREGGILDWQDLVIGQLDPAWVPIFRRTDGALDSGLSYGHAIAWLVRAGSVPDGHLFGSAPSPGLDGREFGPEPDAPPVTGPAHEPETAAQAAWRAVAELEAFLADPAAAVGPAPPRSPRPVIRPWANVLSQGGLAALAFHLAPDAPADAFADAIDAILAAAARAGPGLGGLLAFLGEVDRPPPPVAAAELTLEDALAHRLRSERGLARSRLARLAGSAVLRQTCQLDGAGPFITPLLASDRGAISRTLPPSGQAAALAEGLGDELGRVRALDAIAAEWARAVSDIRADSRVRDVIALLFEEPAITAKRLRVRLGLSVRASHSAVDALVRRRIVREVTGRRWFRVFIADALAPSRSRPMV
jgi:hypothetical protein